MMFLKLPIGFALLSLSLMTWKGQHLSLPASSDQVWRLMATASRAAQMDQSSSQREYRFLSVNKSSTLEKELNEQARQGWRLWRVPQVAVGGLAAMMWRETAANKTQQYEYKVLDTIRESTMQKELTAAAEQGYELRGLGWHSALFPYTPEETVVVLERPVSRTQPRFEYRLLSTKRESTMQKEIEAVVSEGFRPSQLMVSVEAKLTRLLMPNFVYTLILSRSVEHPAAEMGKYEYRLFSATKVGTMEKEINRAAQDGFRFYLSSPFLAVLMAREYPHRESRRFEYKLLATRKTSALQKELPVEGQRGFGYCALTNSMAGITMLLEREAADGGKPLPRALHQREYKLLAATREGTTQKEISEAVAAGYRLVDLTAIGEFIAVLERETENKNMIKPEKK